MNFLEDFIATVMQHAAQYIRFKRHIGCR